MSLITSKIIKKGQEKSIHQFYWAEAVIDGEEVIVSSPQILFPVAVRCMGG